MLPEGIKEKILKEMLFVPSGSFLIRFAFGKVRGYACFFESISPDSFAGNRR